MVRDHLSGVWTLILATIFAAGCGAATDKSAPKAAPEATPVPGASAAGGAESDKNAVHASAAAEKSGLSRELDLLPPEEREIAAKQKTCPVTDEPLGSMGKPYKVTEAGQTVYLCCKGCEDDFRKEPAKYLAKLKNAQGK